MSPALQAVLVILGGVSACIGYFYLSNLLLDRVLFPPRGPQAGRNIRLAGLIRPWLFLFPALFGLSLYLFYPVLATLWLSLHGKGGDFVGLANYRQMASEAKFWESMRNNMLWLLVVPALSTAFGLLAAQLTDRIRWGNLAKSLIFMPMAISFVGASVIWKLIYDTRPEGSAQIGLLNALWLQFDGGLGSVIALTLVPVAILLATILALLWAIWALVWPLRDAGARGTGWLVALRLLVAGLCGFVAVELAGWILAALTMELPYGKPQNWLSMPYWNSYFLMIVLVWIQTGFAMVILSAALRGVPEETIEAAILDGANPFQIFFRIKLPQIMPTVVVVWTTITIVVLKVFDIVLAMTNGQWETQVLANYMYDKLFRALDWGVGSASAMVIMLLVVPILVWNVWNARKELR